MPHQTIPQIRSVEPRQNKITARLAAQGAMLEELRTLIPLLKPDTARADARKAILEDNILKRSSLGSRAKSFAKISQRYLRTDAQRATAQLVLAMQHTADPLQAALVAYVMLLWNDALVFTLGCEWLAPKLSGPSFAAVTSDVEAELERLSKQLPHIRKWTPVTRKRVAQHYLGLLRDCHYANGTARKLLRRPYIPPDVVLFGARLVIGGGESGTRIPEHPLFVAMGLSIDEVITALTELRQQGRVEFSIQGGVIHFAVRKEE